MSWVLCQFVDTFPLKRDNPSARGYMEAHVLHIGADDCHRVAVLRSVGFRVDECASLPQLARALEKAKRADAVFVTKSQDTSLEKAISMARERSLAPVILFQNSIQESMDEQYDLVIPPLTSPDKWLREVRGLLEGTRASRANSRPGPSQSAVKIRNVRRYSPESTMECDSPVAHFWNARHDGP